MLCSSPPTTSRTRTSSSSQRTTRVISSPRITSQPYSTTWRRCQIESLILVSAIAITKKKSDGSIQYSVQIDCLQVVHVQIIGSTSSVLSQILSVSLGMIYLSFFMTSNLLLITLNSFLYSISFLSFLLIFIWAAFSYTCKCASVSNYLKFINGKVKQNP